MSCPKCGAEMTPASEGLPDYVCEECGWALDLEPYETEPVDKFIERMGRKRRRM